MKTRYEARSFTPAALEVIRQADAICADYARQGYGLTLRQLYYRFIATDAFPDSRWFCKEPGSDREIPDPDHSNPRSTKNVQRNYKWLGDLISNARVAGLIDWDHLEDRTRSLSGGDSGFRGVPDALSYLYRVYQIPHHGNQPIYTEVWVEKEALADVISRPADRWRIAYFACKGYVSQSEMHEAAQRLKRYEAAGRKCEIIHLGDHDPSGIDMTRDISDRLAMFGATVEVDRIALTIEQVHDFGPPPSPAKITDSRAAEYIAAYGDESWELDALDPPVLEAMVENAIQARLDMDLWREAERRQTTEEDVINSLAASWFDVERWMRGQEML